MGLNEFQASRPDQANRSIGKVSDEPLTYAGGMLQGTVGVASAELVAVAAAGVATRTITITVPANAAVDADGYAVTINEAAAAVAATHFRIAAGGSFTITTLGQLRAIRNGASDVRVNLLIGVKA